MPINVTLSADELKALLAMREEHAALQREHDELRSTLRLVTAERDLAEERLRAYRRELFGAKSEARDSDQYGLFNVSMSTIFDGPMIIENDGQSAKQVQLTAMTHRHKELDNTSAGISRA